MSFNLQQPINESNNMANTIVSSMTTHLFGGGFWDPQNRRSWLRDTILAEVPEVDLLRLLQMSIEQVDNHLLGANTEPVGLMWREWCIDATIWSLFSQFFLRYLLNSLTRWLTI